MRRQGAGGRGQGAGGTTDQRGGGRKGGGGAASCTFCIGRRAKWEAAGQHGRWMRIRGRGGCHRMPSGSLGHEAERISKKKVRRRGPKRARAGVAAGGAAALAGKLCYRE